MRQFLAMLGLLFVLAIGLVGGLTLGHYSTLDEIIFEVVEDEIVPSVQEGSQAMLNVLNR